MFDSVDGCVLEGGAGEVYSIQVDVNQFWIFDAGSIKLHIAEIAVDEGDVVYFWPFEGEVVEVALFEGGLIQVWILDGWV